MSENKIWTLLLVDDDQAIQELFKESLEDLSFKVLVADNAKAAFEIAKNKKIDCLVTDIVMPEENGTVLVDKLKNINIHVPVFFITGYLDFSRDELNKYKPKAIIFKPFDVEEAAILIKNHLMRIG